MATVKDVKKGFCDDVYTELSGMKGRLLAMRDNIARAYGADTNIFGLFERHLCELVDQIDWKLQILSHACPYDWKGSSEYEENTVSVGPVEKQASDFSGGYLGG
jgi:hypothetical protein